jgi:ankyrin repeat protein
MRDSSENIQQDVLITRFNQFAALAKGYLGIDIAPLNERGCCYALALYNIKHASEGTLNQFYHYINTIANQFTEDLMPQLLQRAQISADQKTLHHMTQGSVLSEKYHDFQFMSAYGPVQFSKLMDFVQGVSKAQVGYASKMARSRFIDRRSQWRMGRLESIKGNWENSYSISGTKDTLIDALRRAHLTDHHYALIQSGNHAITFRRTDDNRFLVYDSNDQSYSRTFSSVDEVANAIINDFERVGNLSATGYITLSVDTASIEHGDRELKKVIQQYRHELIHYKPIEDIAKTCHAIIMEYHSQGNNLNSVAGGIAALCEQLKDEGKVQSTREFIKMLPAPLQPVVLECLNYDKRSDFVRVVEGKEALHYDASKVSSEQKAPLESINELFSQYYEGYLCRTDFSNNVVRLIEDLKQTATFEQLQTQPVYSELLQLEHFLKAYLDNSVTASDLLQSMSNLDLNARDNTDYRIFHMICEASPNLMTLKAFVEQGEKKGPLSFSLDNRQDYIALNVLLSLGSAEVAEYIATKIDLTSALSANNFSLMKDILDSANAPVFKVLLGLLMQANTKDQFDINQKIAGKSILAHALKMDSPSLVIAALDRQAQLASLSTLDMDELLAKSSTRNLAREYQRRAERQDYTYTHFKADFAKEFNQKGYNEAAIEAEWAKVQAKQQAAQGSELQAEPLLKAYTFEQFQDEHTEKFKAVEQWAIVVEHIMQAGSKENQDRLFEALIRNDHLDWAEQSFIKESTESPTWNVHQQQLFYAAVKAGNAALVERIIAQQEAIDPSQVKSLVNSTLAGGLSVLAEACKRGHNEVAGMLLDNGAEVKGDKAAPLSFAARYCKLEICEKILQKGAGFNDRSSIDKATPLIGVMLSGLSLKDKRERIHSLLTANPDEQLAPQSIDKKMVHEAIIEAVKDTKITLEDIEMLLSTFDVRLPDVRSETGETPAMIALEKGNLVLFDNIILRTGMDLDHNSKFLKIALNVIREQERLKNGGKANYQKVLHETLNERVEKWIHKNPSLVNKPFQDGTTPLMRGAEAGNIAIVELLLLKGADSEAVNTPQLNIQNHGTGSTVIQFALKSENSEMITRVAKTGSNLTIPDRDGYTPMQRIVAKHRPTLFDVMMLKGDQQELTAQDTQDNTLLHLAINRMGADKSVDLIRDLMQQGLDPCKKNKAGQSPLMIALGDEYKNYPVVVAMLEHISARELRQNKDLLAALKPHKEEILKCFKESFKNTDLNNAESKSAAKQRLEVMTQLKNGLGHLFRTKIKISANKEHKLGQLKVTLPQFHLANQVMRELKAFKNAFLEEGQAKKATNGEQKRHWKNL